MSASGFYDWRQQQREPCKRAREDTALTDTITEIHRQSRGTYGAPRIHAELRLGRNIRVGRKRVERLLRAAGLQGITRRRRRGCTRRDLQAVPSDDLVASCSTPTGPDDHLRAELVVDALDMALWRRRPAAGTVHHADHGTQYTSWAFGQRLRHAGLLGSMGTVGDALDNAVAESFFATLQTELLDRHSWSDRRQLARAIFEYIECFYNPIRRHSYCNMLSPADHDRTNRIAAQPAA